MILNNNLINIDFDYSNSSIITYMDLSKNAIKIFNEFNKYCNSYGFSFDKQ